MTCHVKEMEVFEVELWENLSRRHTITSSLLSMNEAELCTASEAEGLI